MKRKLNQGFDIEGVDEVNLTGASVKGNKIELTSLVENLNNEEQAEDINQGYRVKKGKKLKAEGVEFENNLITETKKRKFSPAESQNQESESEAMEIDEQFSE